MWISLETLCYLLLGLFTAANLYDALPLHANVALFSVFIIIAGSKRSAS